jgi:Fe-Mn family superoxide dismutase
VFDFDTPFGRVVDHIFKGEAGFKKAIKDQALALFGSGWVWLEVDIGGSEPTLVLSATQNQDSPFMKTGRYPIFALDVWEHAYYLQYKTKRADYVDAFWNIFNFDEVNNRYFESVGGGWTSWSHSSNSFGTDSATRDKCVT